jgi:hypothetical protein
MEANYSKKLGLPGYSSHQFMVTVRMELSDINQVAAESSRLYALLQSAVDQEIQKSGWLPENQSIPIRNGNGHSTPTNGNGSENGRGYSQSPTNGTAETWACSDKQRDFILKIVDENKLEKKAVDQLAHERFSKGVRQLNKLEAAGLIEELLEQYGGNRSNGGNGSNGNHRFQRYQRSGAK